MRIKWVVGFVLSLVLIAAVSCGKSGGNDEEEADPAQSPEEAVPTASFVTFGDWGAGTDEQEEVAGAIGDYCASETCEFVLTLGDNIYSSGVDSTDDPLWQSRFVDVYTDLGLPFYAVLGNHDTYGESQAQIDYSAVNPLWIMPAENYTFCWPLDVSPCLVEFFLFNSEEFEMDDAVWLGRRLAASGATWKILVMHHPIYSNGNHGDDNKGNNEILIPTVCDRIDFVLSGHDHNFAHLKSDEDGCPIDQLVIGTGGVSLREVEDDPRVLADGVFHGFGWLEFTPTDAIFRMIDKEGAVFYTTSWTKP